MYAWTKGLIYFILWMDEAKRWQSEKPRQMTPQETQNNPSDGEQKLLDAWLATPITPPSIPIPLLVIPSTSFTFYSFSPYPLSAGLSWLIIIDDDRRHRCCRLIGCRVCHVACARRELVPFVTFITRSISPFFFFPLNFPTLWSWASEWQASKQLIDWWVLQSPFLITLAPFRPASSAFRIPCCWHRPPS